MSHKRLVLILIGILSCSLFERAHGESGKNMESGLNDNDSLVRFGSAEYLALHEKEVDEEVIQILIDSSYDLRFDPSLIARASMALGHHNQMAVDSLVGHLRPGQTEANQHFLVLLYWMGTKESKKAYETYRPSDFSAPPFYNPKDYETRQPAANQLPVRDTGSEE